jgi:ABC-type transport system substrate-binding protein
MQENLPGRCKFTFAVVGVDSTEEVQAETYACLIDPGVSGNTAGPPDSWFPPEPGYIEELFKLNANSEWERIEDLEEIAASVEEAAWREYNKGFEDWYP